MAVAAARRPGRGSVPLRELTYKQLKSEIDPRFLKARERIRELRKRGTRYAGLRGSSMIFRTFSSDYGKNGVIYEQEVKLFDLAEKLRQPDRLLRDRVLDALVRGDVGLRCTCPSFVYWGFGYILHHRGAAAPGRTLWPVSGPKAWPAPVKRRPRYYGAGSRRNRNWMLKGIMCKHLGLIMEVLGFHWASVVRDLKKQGHE